VSYIDVTVWGKQAEVLNPYLVKGRQICVNGELRQSKWEQDGQSRSKIEVVANNVQLLGGGGGSQNGESTQNTFQKNQGSRGEPSAQNRKPQGFTNQGGDFPGPEQFDDDIPF
jgi:single-strand DNA-binding protein